LGEKTFEQVTHGNKSINPPQYMNDLHAPMPNVMKLTLNYELKKKIGDEIIILAIT